jgi:hypothetical protein
MLQNDPLIEPTGIFAGVTFTANYATGGDTLDLTASKILDPSLLGVLGPNQNPIIPPDVINENLDGYYIEIIPGNALNTWKVQCFESEGNELAAGAYPAAFTTGTPVTLKIIFNANDR